MISLSDAYFEDEIREGFYVPATMKQCWGAEIEVLNEIDRVCKKHGLNYYACWGTLLGAIRHGGMIPWDDDFDIMMLRSDYKKFMEVWKSELPEGFDVINYKTHPSHIYFLSNVVGKSRICFEKEHLERFHGFPYITGIDIFVLDNMHRDPEVESQRMKIADLIVTVADKIFDESLTGSKAEESLKLIEEKCNVKIPRNLKGVDLRIYMYSVAEDWFAAVPDEESDTVTQIMPWGIEGRDYVFDRADFDDVIELPFENGTIPVISRYMNLLDKSYGEYMRIYKDVGAHEYPFYDGQKEELKKVLDFDMPEFRFNESMLRDRKADLNSDSAQNYKSICLGVVGEMEQFVIMLPSAGDNLESILGEIQQAAIDLGNFIDSVKGEGYITVSRLEALCEEVYQYSQDTSDDRYKNIQNIIAAVRNDIETRKEVVLMPFKSDYWDSMKSLYEKAVNDDLTDVFVVPLPYYYKNYDGTLRGKQYDLDSYPEELKIINCEEYNIELRHPDKIIIQNPYDEYNDATSVPPYFYSKNIRNYTDELIYVPWFTTAEFDEDDARAYKNMRSYVTMPGVIYADKVYVQSEKIRGMYIDKLCECAGEDYREVFDKKIDTLKGCCTKSEADEKKYSVSVISSDISLEDKSAKTLVFMPDYSQLLEHADVAIDKINRSLATMKKAHDETGLNIIWIHQEIIDELMPTRNAKLYEAYVNVKNDFAKDGWGKVTKYGDISLQTGELYVYHGSSIERFIDSVSAYYGDSGIVANFMRNAKKPVMIQDYDI